MKDVSTFYADGYRLEPGLADVALICHLRGEEQVRIVFPMLIAKALAQNLLQLVQIYEERSETLLPPVEELQQKLSASSDDE